MAVKKAVVIGSSNKPEELQSGDSLYGIASAYASLTDGATITIACDAQKAEQNAKVTLGGNRSLTWSSLADGMRGTLVVVQDGTGSRTLTVSNPGGFTNKKRGGTLTLTAAAGSYDVVSWVVVDTVIYITVGAFS